MKKLLLLIIVLALGAGGYWYWTQHNAPVPTQAAANSDARALTAAEQSAFLPLVCGGAGAGSGYYAHSCTSLPGYPSDDYGGAGTGLGITLTSIITGHLTNATDNEAYVSYQGSFEAHIDNFGGGILFLADGKGGWRLKKWVQGGNMDGCLSLNPQGRPRFLCPGEYTNQGETDTVLTLMNIPSTEGTNLLRASDLRGTMEPNGNCGLRRQGQDVLLIIDSLSRAGSSFAAGIEYVPAAQAEAACKAKAFANAPVSKTTLTLGWDGSAMTINPKFNFAPSS